MDQQPQHCDDGGKGNGADQPYGGVLKEINENLAACLQRCGDPLTEGQLRVAGLIGGRFLAQGDINGSIINLTVGMHEAFL